MKRRGFTLVELTVVAMIMGMVLVGAASLVSGTIRSFAYTSNQFDSDMSASIALQILNRDLQEAKQVQILSPSSIRVYYPVMTAEGAYDRRETDLINTVDFYRGDSDGAQNPAGDFMVRAQANGFSRPICKAVRDLVFTSISPSSVDISLETATGAEAAVRTTKMTHRAIFLRNY